MTSTRRPMGALEDHVMAYLWAVEEAAAPEVQQAVAPDLASALTLHASFDNGLDADFSRGDRTSYIKKGKVLHHAEPNDDAKLAPNAGRFGGAARVRDNGPCAAGKLDQS